MRKGTTPQFVFELPPEIAEIKNAKVTFESFGDLTLEKHLCDCEIEGNKITVNLTQEETFLFECNSQIKVQLRILTVNDEAFASEVYTVNVSECLDSEVLE